ncbi:MAG TPA: acyl-CoA dehydrogenase family protein, partial [Solirubrobacteraceae bacterium]|nr:acyl-CoA dehydrogenase family protein [Solirubrobacteraceae bacterium]
LRALTPVAKLFTGKQAVAAASETLEAFGGAGYIEDTGLPRMLRDAQVLPIWEGTTNVLSLDTLRALAKGGAMEAIAAEVESCCAAATDAGLAEPVRVARTALQHAAAWIAEAMTQPDRLEAGARRFAMTLGRTLELALLARHAQWCIAHGHGPRMAAAARRFAQSAVDLVGDAALEDTRLLA